MGTAAGVKIYKFTERVCEYLIERTAPLAYPGRNTPLPPVLVVALPKSGSIFLQRALGRTLRVKIRHIGSGGMWGSTLGYNELCRFEQGNVVSREHLQPRALSLRLLATHGVRKAVLHLRDPRAAIVSWTRHMDRTLASRGLRSVELSCESAVPDAYREWSFEQRLYWQVENTMPRFIDWVEGWLALVESSRDVEFLVTGYEALNNDAFGLLTRILEFYEIDYEPDWISIPMVRVGKHNIHTMPDRPTACVDDVKPSWAASMTAETLRAANAMVPKSMLDRFNWLNI